MSKIQNTVLCLILYEITCNSLQPNEFAAMQREPIKRKIIIMARRADFGMFENLGNRMEPMPRKSKSKKEKE